MNLMLKTTHFNDYVFSLTAPAPAAVPVPGPKTHPSASSGKMLLPLFGTFIILISASAICLFVAL